MLIFFEDQSSASFSQNKSVATFVKRTRRSFVFIIVCGECMHGIESTDTRLADHSFRSAGYKNVSLAQPDQVVGIDNSVSSRCTCGYCCIIRTSEAILDRNMPCCNIRND